MTKAERFYRELTMCGRSMGRRRRLPRWAETAACWVALGAMMALLGCVFCRALDSEAALWQVGDYGAPEEVESWR